MGQFISHKTMSLHKIHLVLVLFFTDLDVNQCTPIELTVEETSPNRYNRQNGRGSVNRPDLVGPIDDIAEPPQFGGDGGWWGQNSFGGMGGGNGGMGGGGFFGGGIIGGGIFGGGMGGNGDGGNVNSICMFAPQTPGCFTRGNGGNDGNGGGGNIDPICMFAPQYPGCPGSGGNGGDICMYAPQAPGCIPGGNGGGGSNDLICVIAPWFPQCNNAQLPPICNDQSVPLCSGFGGKFNTYVIRFIIDLWTSSKQQCQANSVVSPQCPFGGVPIVNLTPEIICNLFPSLPGCSPQLPIPPTTPTTPTTWNMDILLKYFRQAYQEIMSKLQKIGKCLEKFCQDPTHTNPSNKMYKFIGKSEQVDESEGNWSEEERDDEEYQESENDQEVSKEKEEEDVEDDIVDEENGEDPEGDIEEADEEDDDIEVDEEDEDEEVDNYDEETTDAPVEPTIISRSMPNSMAKKMANFRRF